MKSSIGKTISKAIKENKWISVEYINKENKKTSFWCSVLDIDVYNKILKVEIFNVYKSLDVLTSFLQFDNIKKAIVIEQTFYSGNERLIWKIEKNINKLGWLEFNSFNDKILDYYSEVKRLDVDPFQSDCSNIKGIDCRYLLSKKKVKLNEEQFKEIAEIIYKNEDIEKTNRFSQLAINKLGISRKGKEFIVAYYPLSLDIESKELIIKNHLIINQSFLIENSKVSLASYLSISANEFASMLIYNYNEAKELLRENMNSSEKINENPMIMLISRTMSFDYDSVYEAIVEKHKNNTLNLPLKAFFGQLSNRNKGRVEPDIVLMDDKADIDQVRVVYNAMKNPVTYVQGPPGTGKTTTLMNVILSTFLSNQTCLICSNNNQPINDILKKFKFKNKDKDVIFPIIRLGNRNELDKSLDWIEQIINEDDNRIRIFEDRLEELTRETSDTYNDLKDLLAKYEYKKELIEKKQCLDKFSSYVSKTKSFNNNLLDKITKRSYELDKEIRNIPTITDKKVLSKVTFLKDDRDFMMYLYYNSYKYLKRLKQPSYEELRDIVDIEDKEERVTEFSKWLKEDENFKKFLRVFPIVACTNISCLKLGGNEVYFDMCIMDEAGQCDVAASLVPISKAKHLLLVGDVNQLQPVITIDSYINDRLMKKYEVPREYDYCNNSIINLMTHVDEISTQILLSYHYRCGKRIADYSNDRYYDGKLKIKTDLNDNQLEFIKVKNTNFDKERNSYFSEACAVVDLIKKNNLDENSVSIITPFRNQASLINGLLAKNGINAKCGTIHTVQGAENKVVIFSPAIGLKSSKKTYEWLANNKELINVAVTRAKEKLIFVGDDEALDLLASKDKDDDIISLSNYVKKNGKVTVSQSKVNRINIGFSNDSKSEEELFETMAQYCSVYDKFHVERNILVRKVLKDIDDESLIEYFNKAEFDLVLYSIDSFGNRVPYLVIELNGGEHYTSHSRTIINDKKKMEICEKKNIKYLSIPNSYSKSYDTLFDLISTLDIDYDDKKNTLFDLEE